MTYSFETGSGMIAYRRVDLPSITGGIAGAGLKSVSIGDIWQRNHLMAYHWATPYRFPTVDSHMVGYRSIELIMSKTVEVWSRK